MAFIVNTRILNGQMTGVQRYLCSILSNAPSNNIQRVSPTGILSGFSGHIWEQLYLPCHLMNENSNVLWSPSNTGPLMYSANQKQVVTIHDFATLDHPEWTSRQFSYFYRFLLPKLVKRCDGIIAISEYTKSRILHHVNIDPKKIIVIRNGVEPKFFKNNYIQNVQSIIRKKYGIPAGRYVLSVSSIEPRKNISRLLNAWSNICSKIDDDIYLVLVGRSNPRIFADSGLNDIPKRVIFTGFVDDVDLPVLYQGAFLFAYLSIYEGFGLPPLEAMAAGVAVLTSDVTSIPEVVADKAITVNPFSIADIADGLLLLLKNDSLRQQMANAGYEHARGFDWGCVAKQTFDFIRKFE